MSPLLIRPGHPQRYAVLGAAGQLGRALLAVDHLDSVQVVALPRADLDVADRQTLGRALAQLRPDLVVNAAAYTAVDQAESEPARAFAVNRDGAANVAEACAALDIPLIHLSTDYVFDGRKATLYDEEDTPAPLSVYGFSKAEGERLARERHERCAILRTSWLFSADGKNFVKTVAKLAQERETLRVVADQRGCPTPAIDLAEAILALAHTMSADRSVAGIYHFAGAEPVSWHGFAEAIIEELEPSLIRRPRLVAIATEDYPTAAQRPRNSVLCCQKIAQLGIRQKSWRPGLRAVIEQMSAGNNRRLRATPGSEPCPIFSS